MAKRAWLFTAHCPETTFTSYQNISEDDILVAVDGGLEFMHQKALEPDVIIGDMDSIHNPELLSAYPKAKILRFPSAKNETDTELALNWCLSEGLAEAIICNDLGGRFDHALALIQNLLHAHENGLNAKIDAGNSQAFFLQKHNTLDFPVGSLLSLVSWTETSQLISSTGLKYSLQDLLLSRSLSRGISNIITSKPATIELKEGLVFCHISIF